MYSLVYKVIIVDSVLAHCMVVYTKVVQLILLLVKMFY